MSFEYDRDAVTLRMEIASSFFRATSASNESTRSGPAHTKRGAARWSWRCLSSEGPEGVPRPASRGGALAKGASERRGTTRASGFIPEGLIGVTVPPGSSSRKNNRRLSLWLTAKGIIALVIRHAQDGEGRFPRNLRNDGRFQNKNDSRESFSRLFGGGIRTPTPG